MAGLTLLESIEMQCNGKAVSEIKELNFNKCISKSIEGLTKDYISLEVLSFKGIGLENISGLPRLPNLYKLDLSDNMLADGFEVLLKCPELEELDLSNNKIKDVSALIPLSKLFFLQNLKLKGCQLADAKGYPDSVLSTIPQLKKLDDAEGTFQNGDVGEEDDVSDDEDDDEGEEEEYGLEALQRSGELEDDDEEEDYAPGDEEEAEFDDYDLGDEEDDEVEDDGANLSGADVSGPRRPGSKRRHSDKIELGNGKTHEDAPSTKHRPTEEELENHNEEAVDK